MKKGGPIQGLPFLFQSQHASDSWDVLKTPHRIGTTPNQGTA